MFLNFLYLFFFYIFQWFLINILQIIKKKQYLHEIGNKMNSTSGLTLYFCEVCVISSYVSQNVLCLFIFFSFKTKTTGIHGYRICFVASILVEVISNLIYDPLCWYTKNSDIEISLFIRNVVGKIKEIYDTEIEFHKIFQLSGFTPFAGGAHQYRS